MTERVALSKPPGEPANHPNLTEAVTGILGRCPIYDSQTYIRLAGESHLLIQLSSENQSWPAGCVLERLYRVKTGIPNAARNTGLIGIWRSLNFLISVKLTFTLSLVCG